MIDVLEDDAALEQYCYEATGVRFGPFVRASTYRVYNWDSRFEVGEYFDDWRSPEPRRPVVMRGARRRIIAENYSAKSHYAYDVARRYLETYRITILTPEGACEMRKRMMAHFDRRSIYVRDVQYILPYHVCRNTDGGKVKVYVEGKEEWVFPAELSRLQRKFRKSGKLGEWDAVPITRRLDDIVFRRKQQQFERLDRLARSFKSLLRVPYEKRSARAELLLQRENLTASRC